MKKKPPGKTKKNAPLDAGDGMQNGVSLPENGHYAELKDQRQVYLDHITISDLEGIRLILNGHSVADWARLNFKGRRDIENFLKVNGFDTRRPADLERLNHIRDEAVEYIGKELGKAIPDSVLDCSVVELFQNASGSPRRDKDQIYSCMILKVMHTINYVDAHELFHRWSVSEKELFRLVEKRLNAVVTTMKRYGFNIVEFQSDHKKKSSLVTKLLARKETHGSEVYDRIRLRIVIKSKSDLLPILYFLGRNFCPFNYVVPGNSNNNLLSFEAMIQAHPRFTKHLKHLQRYVGGHVNLSKVNRFSSDNYRVINFIAEIPLRIDRTLKHNLTADDFRELGRVVFTPVEFQIVDRQTAISNERGEASHEKYKKRQKQEVVNRLQLGSVKDFMLQ